jgi:hypothetical protein
MEQGNGKGIEQGTGKGIEQVKEKGIEQVKEKGIEQAMGIEQTGTGSRRWNELERATGKNRSRGDDCTGCRN